MYRKPARFPERVRFQSRFRKNIHYRPVSGRRPAVAGLEFIVIRKADKRDFEELSNVWLQASVKAHDFMPSEFWESRLENMRDAYLPGSETWAFESEGELLGFFSLVGDRLAAVFVRPDAWKQGVGKALITKAKSMRLHLELTVYLSNGNAVQFYRKHGFAGIREQTDKETGFDELFMVWNA